MADMNDPSLSAGTDNVAMRRPHALSRRSPAAIWRLRPALQPVSVVKTIKTQIIPRIVLALRTPLLQKASEPVAEPAAPQIEAFAALVLGRDDLATFDYVEDLLTRGATVESVFLDLLAPAARHLGTLWDTDATDFANVTLGVSRLQRAIWRLGESFVNEVANQSPRGDSILLTIIPGEQHSFGLSMVAEFFRRAGWNLCTGPFATNQELTTLVHHQWFDIVGFSVSSDRRLDDLKKDIHIIRRDSRNRNVGIVLGGPLLIEHPELVASVGADMISNDAKAAPQEASGLIVRMTSRE